MYIAQLKVNYLNVAFYFLKTVVCISPISFHRVLQDRRPAWNICEVDQHPKRWRGK